MTRNIPTYKPRKPSKAPHGRRPVVSDPMLFVAVLCCRVFAIGIAIGLIFRLLRGGGLS